MQIKKNFLFFILFLCVLFNSTSFAKDNKWELFNEGLEDLDSPVHVVGTKDLSTVFGITFGGIYKTIDHGANWKLLDNGIFANTYNQILIAPSQQSTLYLSSFIGGLYQSENGGKSWLKINTPNDSNRFYKLLAIHPNNPQEFYISDNSYWIELNNLNFLFKTTDSGKTWEKQTGFFSADYRIEEMLIHTENPLIRFIVLETRNVENKLPNMLLRSLDGGKTWQTMKMNLKNLAFSGHTFFAIFQNNLYQSTDVGDTWKKLNTPTVDEITGFRVNENNKNEIYLFGSENFKTIDSGKTWKKIQVKGNLVLNQKNPKELLAWNDHAIFRTVDNGETWQSRITGVTNAKVYSVVIDPYDNNFIYVVTRDGVWLTTNAKTWKKVTALKDNFIDSITIDPINPRTIYAVGFRKIYKSEDRGLTWQSLQRPAFADNDLVINPLNNNQLFIVANASGPKGSFGKIYRSDDQGKNWQELGEMNSFIYWLGFNPHQTNELFLCTGNAIWKSIDGKKWTLVFDFGKLQNSKLIKKLVFDPYNPDNIFVLAYSGTIFKSVDGAKTWIQLTLPVHKYDAVSSLIIDPKDTNTLYASTHEEGINKRGHGIFISHDSGLNWVPFNEGINSLSIADMQMNKKRELFAGTDGTGIFKRQLN